MRHPWVVSLVAVGIVAGMVCLPGCGDRSGSKPANTPAAADADSLDDPGPSGDPDPGDLPASLAENASGLEEDGQLTPAGSALTSIFSPARAPKRKTMGLLQRSFLDIAAQGDQELEVALVIDGTDSMAKDLQGVRQSILQMLGDLRRYRSNSVRAAIVVYRDDGSDSGPVSIPLGTFTDDEATIAAAVENLRPESGAPYFHELVDLGIYKAVYDLPWTLDDQVSKWILLFGDAPPYAESRVEKENPQGFRRFGTTALVGAAKAKGIRINCVLCTSSDRNDDAYKKSLDETRTFMNRLAGGTDGLMLDLSNPQIESALVEAAKQPQRQYREIEPITAIDLAAVRNVEQPAEGDSKVKTVRLAILPHMPLDQIQTVGIRPQDKGVQVATALRTRLAKVRGVRVASPVEIQRQMRRFAARNLSAKQRLRGLAGQLGVDYIVWGQAAAGGASYQTAAYRRDNGEQAVKTVNLPADSDPGDWAFRFISAAAQASDQDQDLAKLLSAVDDPEAIQQPMSSNATNSAELLEAMEALEQALEYDMASDQSKSLLETADRASKAVAKNEPRNALAHWLQANVAYNQASHLYTRGETEAAKKRMQEMKTALKRARDSRSSIKIPSLVTEIEADFLLLIQRDVAKAIQRYELMTSADYPLASQLRGHWMLAGIYAGDWGNADASLINANQARTHLMYIMANWPESPEATLLKTWLKYDETSQQTEYNFLPMVNVELSGV